MVKYYPHPLPCASGGVHLRFKIKAKNDESYIYLVFFSVSKLYSFVKIKNGPVF
jgi:hypothetical protein